MKRLILLFLVSCGAIFSQQNALLLPWTPQQFTNTNGTVLANGKVCTYQAGTSTGLATFTDATAAVSNNVPPNAILLDSTGRPTSGGIWLSAARAYKITVLTAGSDSTCNTGVTIKTQDNVSASNVGANNTFTGTNTFSSLNGCVVVDGTTYAKTNAGIQAAVNATPANGCLYLPVGTYALTATANEQIKLTQPISFVCASWGTNLQLQSGAGSIPLLHIAPTGVSGFVAYGFRIQDCQFSTAVAGLGTYAIQVDTTTTGSISKLVIDHVYAGCTNTGLFLCTAGSGFGTGSIAFNNPTGTGGLFDSGIYRSILYGNVSMTRLGDAVSVVDNQFFQNANADQFYVDFFAGSTIFQLQHNTMEIPLQFGCVTASSAAANGAIIEQNAWEPQNTTLVGSNGAMLDLNGCAASNASYVKIKNNSFQLSGNSSTLNAVRVNFATQIDIGGRAGENQFFLTTGGTCAAATCHAYISTANAFANRFNHNIYSPNTWTGSSGSVFDDVAANTTVTEDTIFNGGASPLLSQASAGGTNLYGFNGIAFQAANGANHITDGSGGANIALSASSAPVASPVASSFITVPSFAFKEIAAPSGTAAFDICYGDSTSHFIKCSYNNGTFFQIPQVITATSAAFATATTAGTCVQNTTAVTNAATTMAVSVAPVSTPGVGAVWSAFVSSAGNVTINECAVATSAGGSIAFNIRVTP